MRRVAVTGGRYYAHPERVHAVLDVELQAGPFVLVHGACPTGVDRHADRWARANGVQVERHPAEWGVYGGVAGSMRNLKMALSGLSKLIKFPGGRGTMNMVGHCRREGVHVEVHDG